jgi:hypothetical protein
MKLTKKNPQISDNAIGEISLISTFLSSINIYIDKNDVLNIEIKAHNIYTKKMLVLRFINVSEYCFYHNSKYIFYNVENYKFLKNQDDMYYLSLDPDENVDGISKDDQDFIISDEFEFFSE